MLVHIYTKLHDEPLGGGLEPTSINHAVIYLLDQNLETTYLADYISR
jgi:hypothetical protein